MAPILPETGLGFGNASFHAGFRIGIKDLIRAGNVRRIVIEHEGRTIADFPLTVGVVGVVLAPVAAALGTLVALLQDCTIHVERVRSQSGETGEATAGS